MVVAMRDVLLLDHWLWSDKRLAVAAIAVHALYTALNTVRIQGHDCHDSTLDLLRTSACHAAAGIDTSGSR